MKKIIRSSVLVAALLAATVASAAGVDGTWVGSAGQQQITFVFKTDGEKLTGTIENSAAPGAIEIKDGKIKGDEISFHLVRNLQDTETKIEWSGKLAGEELKLTRAAVGNNQAAEVTAKRAEAKSAQ